MNTMRLKGIHLAIKSGMLAAETIFEGLVKGDLSAAQLATYERRVAGSWIKDEMWKVRNFHQVMSKNLYTGMLRTSDAQKPAEAGLYCETLLVWFFRAR